MSFARSVRVAWVLVAASVAGCSALVDPDTRKLEPQPVACQPGEVASCQCDGGNWSTQTCTASGSYDPCACGPATVSVGGNGGNSGHRAAAPIGEAGSPAR